MWEDVFVAVAQRHAQAEHRMKVNDVRRMIGGCMGSGLELDIDMEPLQGILSFQESNLGPSAPDRVQLTFVSACAREYSVGSHTKLVFLLATVDIRTYVVVFKLIY